MTPYARHAYNKLDSISIVNAGTGQPVCTNTLHTPAATPFVAISPATRHAVDLQDKSVRARPASAPSRYDDISLGPSLGACSSRH